MITEQKFKKILEKINYKIDLEAAVYLNNLNKNNKNFKQINEIQIIEGFLKGRGYSKYGNIFTKGFVFIILDSKDNKIVSLSFYHDIPNSIKSQIITESFITGTNLFCDYYEKL